jgi:Gas vesicle synthesis protein GvpO
MPSKTETARAERSESRARRRGGVEKFEELEDAATNGSGPSSGRGDVVPLAAKVVGTAVAAGLLGALGGAAKALLERRGSPDEPASAPPSKTADEPSPEEEPRAQDPEQEEQHEQEPPEPARERDEAEGDESAEQPRGVSGDEAAGVIAQARRELEALLGVAPESVSGLERADGRWSVMLEVVEVARIPESTDVLATYELVLDEDGGVAGVNRLRRYRRSQVDDAS